MTREEAIKELELIAKVTMWNDRREAVEMAIEALHHVEAEEKGYCHRIIPSNIEVVVRCKDCRHAHECHKSVHYTRNEQSTVTIGYAPIEWCSRGERRNHERK